MLDESVYEFDHDLNRSTAMTPVANDAPLMKVRRMVSGAWKTMGSYLQAGTRSYEYQDTCEEILYVGFRSVMTFTGAWQGGGERGRSLTLWDQRRYPDPVMAFP